MPEKVKGVVKAISNAFGFGLIAPAEGAANSGDICFRKSGVAGEDGFRTLFLRGKNVEFEVVDVGNGAFEAINVTASLEDDENGEEGKARGSTSLRRALDKPSVSRASQAMARHLCQFPKTPAACKERRGFGFGGDDDGPPGLCDSASGSTDGGIPGLCDTASGSTDGGASTGE